VSEGSIHPDERGDPTAGLVVDDALPIAEQLVIDSCRDSTPGGLANKINAINKNRRDALRDLNLNIDQYLASLWL